MTYSIITPKSVQKQLDALPDEVFDRIATKIQQLAEDPRPAGVVKMKGADNEYRIRIGDYRVRYEIHDNELLVLLIQCKTEKMFTEYKTLSFLLKTCLPDRALLTHDFDLNRGLLGLTFVLGAFVRR